MKIKHQDNKELKMKRILTGFLIVFSMLSTAVSANDNVLNNAYNNQKSDIQVRGSGKVYRILADDNQGSRHQKFILRLRNQQTILIAHNIDLAPRIDKLKVGDTVKFHGEYEWNNRGGVVHWTHNDPQGRHADGWLKHNGRTYR